MSNDSLIGRVPVPYKILQQFNKLILPNENIDPVFDELEYTVDTCLDNSIWGNETNMTTIPRSATLDMFFPKLCKQEPVSPEKHGKTDHYSSESEFEMVHKVKYNYSKTSIKKEPPSPNVGTKKLDNSDSNNSNFLPSKNNDNNDVSLFHSTAIGQMHENIPLNVEESGICGSESISSSSESVDEPVPAVNHGKIASATDELQVSKNIKSPQKHNQEPRKSTEKTKDCSITKSPPKEIHNKPVIDTTESSSEESCEDIPIVSQAKKTSNIKKNISDAHTMSDDDIIPSSQDVKPGLRLSLGSADKSNIRDVSVKSVINSMRPPKELKQTTLQKISLSETLKSETSLDFSLENSMIEQIKNKMSEIRTLPQESGTDSLSMEDITEEDEIFLIQCPKDVDPASFIGKEFSLEGSSSISLEKRGKAVNYDSFSMIDNSERIVNVVLPTKNYQEVTLGVFPLAGNIILTEAIEEPVLKMPEIEPPRKVKFPESLEEICSGISVSDTSKNDSMNLDCSLHNVHRKKKKKKKKEHLDDANIDFRLEREINDVSIENTLKKKRKFNSLEDSFLPSDSCNDSYTERLPKKKIKLEEENYRTEVDNSVSLSETQSFLDSSKHERKKKKKSSSKDFTELTDTFSLSTTEYLMSSLVKKKKKKKKSHEHNIEEGFDLLREIKMEVDDPERTIFSEVQADDTIIKKKKKKKRHTIGDIENHTEEFSFNPLRDFKMELNETDLTISSELLSDDTITKKKKKKKRHNSGGENEGHFIQPVLPDNTFSEKHKKKHKKKSIE